VVFFGESLPDQFVDLRTEDMKNCDLLLVMGTSLVVYPFASLVNEVKENIPRLLLNKDPVAVWKRYEEDEFAREFNYRDVFFHGPCDQGVQELAKLLGWDKELEEMLKK